MKKIIPQKKGTRILSSEARKRMSEGAKKARAASWGSARRPSKMIRIDAEIAELLESRVPARDRRSVASSGIYSGVQIYLARKDALEQRRRHPENYN